VTAGAVGATAKAGGAVVGAAGRAVAGGDDQKDKPAPNGGNPP